MKRILCVAGLLLCTATAAAETPTQRADGLNNEGKALFKSGKYGEAVEKFEQAIVLAPDARYYFNLCFALNVLERYGDALRQCRLGRKNNPPADLSPKLDRLTVELELRVPPDQRDTGAYTTLPKNADGQGYPPPTGPAFVEQKADSTGYSWSVGAEVGVFHNNTIGKDTPTQEYEKNGPSLHLLANVPFSNAGGLGFRGYIDLAKIGGTRMAVGDLLEIDNDLTMINFGGGVFWDVNISRRFIWSPAFGVQITAFQPTADGQDSLFAGGARIDSTFSFLLGERGNHVISIAPSLIAFGKAGSGSDEARVLGLDKASTALVFALGYCLRFDTPFGAMPTMGLE